MARLKKGITLVELVAMVVLLSGIVLITSSLMVTFCQFYENTVGVDVTEQDAMAALNEIASRFMLADSYFKRYEPVDGQRAWINIGVTSGTTIYRYWLGTRSGSTGILANSSQGSNVMSASPTRLIAPNVTNLSFDLVSNNNQAMANQFKITMTLQLPGGGAQKTYETIVTSRRISAQ